MTLSVRTLVSAFATVIFFTACGNRPPGPTLAPPASSPSPSSATPTNVSAPRLSFNERALLAAAEKGDTAEVQSLLDKGVNVNLRDSDGRTPLTEAVYLGHVDTVKLLLARGADVNAQKIDGATPLTLTQGNKEIQSLLEKKDEKAKPAPPDKGSAAPPSPSPKKRQP